MPGVSFPALGLRFSCSWREPVVLHLVGETGLTLRIATSFYSFGIYRTFLGSVARNLGVPWEEGDVLEERMMTELEKAVLTAD